MIYIDWKEYDLNNIKVGKKIFYNIEFIKIENCNLKLNNLFLRNNIGYKISDITKLEIYFLDLEFNNNQLMIEFITHLEEHLNYLIQKQELEFLKSANLINEQNQLKTFYSSIFKNEYDYFIRLKLPHKNNEFIFEYCDKNNQKIDIQNLKINNITDCNISCNGIWISENSFGISWNLDKISNISSVV